MEESQKEIIKAIRTRFDFVYSAGVSGIGLSLVKSKNETEKQLTAEFEDLLLRIERLKDEIACQKIYLKEEQDKVKALWNRC
jgi:hypothetical protein